MKPLLFNSIVFLFISYSSSSQTDSKFIAHEWGTFTTLQNSNGKLLAGLQRDEEELPRFVYDLCFCEDEPEKGLYTIHATIENVRVKMETPVIYFYSDQEKDVTVDVEFSGGAISQWYPKRTDGEYNPSVIYSINNNVPYEVDFSEPRTGWIQWDATVLAPDDTLTISSNPSVETEQWVRPRETASNLLKVGYQIEKFLFYRGIANFEVPVKVEFNINGDLVISNNFSKKLSYVLVYEKEDGQTANVWWAGELGAESFRVVAKPSSQLTETGVLVEMVSFEDALVDAGLYRDESAAMLNTWKESYFEHAGLKVFWIAPRYFTDEILPISIDPQPDELERVIVGRSEILSPQFEQELAGYPDSIFNSLFKDDRFFLAYGELREEGIPTSWDSKRLETIVDQLSTVKESLIIYPNPAQHEISLKGTFHDDDNMTIRIVRIVNSTGQEIFRTKKKIASGEFYGTFNISTYPDGIYFLLAHSKGFWNTTKFVKSD